DRVVARLLVGEAHSERLAVACPGERPARSDELDLADRFRVEPEMAAQGTNRDFPAWDGEDGGVQDLPAGREANVLSGEGRARGVFEGAFDDLGGALAKYLPGARAVDGFAVDAEPAADFSEDFHLRLGDGAVRPRADIEEQRTVLTDDVDQVVNDRRRGLVVLILDITPGVLRNRGIGLPEEWPNVGKLTALDVEDGGSLGKSLVFVVDRDPAPPFAGSIVVVGREV